MPWSIRTILIISLAGGIFECYVAHRTVNAIAIVTGWPIKRIRLTTGAIMSWFLLYPFALIGSHYLELAPVSRALQSSALLDKLLIYPFWIGTILSAQIGMLLMLIDIARLILFPVYRKHRDRWIRIQARLMTLVICVGSVYVLVRVYSDTFTVRTNDTEIHLKNLPESLDGFRIAQIADVQVDGRTNGSRVSDFVDKVNALNPDLILICGDLVTSGTAYIEQGAAAMGKMHAKHSVYACLGDHDFFTDHTQVSSNLEKNGITVLNNAVALVPATPNPISLVGVTNVYRTRPPESVLQTLEGQRTPAAVNILLTHQPSEWLVKYAEANRYDLLLAGHTHGGQIAFPLPGFLLTGSSFETAYVSGLYRSGSIFVNVTNGFGLTLAPVRYNAPAEITLITLRREP
jgi:predicted MPP superfamily phosphohydrolase